MKLHPQESNVPKRLRAAEVARAAAEEREFDPRSLITEDDHARYLEEIHKLELPLKLKASFYYATLFPDQVSNLQLEEVWKRVEPMLGIVQGEMRAWCIVLFPGRCGLLPAELGKAAQEVVSPQLQPQHIKLRQEEATVRELVGELAAYERPLSQKEGLWEAALSLLETIRQKGRGEGYVNAHAWLRLVDPIRLVGLEPTPEEAAQAVRRLKATLEFERTAATAPEPWFPQSLEHAWSLFVVSAEIHAVEGSLGQAISKPGQIKQGVPLPDRPQV